MGSTISGPGGRIRDWLDCSTHLLGIRLRVGALRIGERPIPIPAARGPHQHREVTQRRGLAAGPLTDDVIRLRHPATVLPTNDKKPPAWHEARRAVLSSSKSAASGYP